MLAGAAGEPFREPCDVGPIFLNFFKEFPGSLGRHGNDALSVKHREHSATAGGRQHQDLLPLPRPSLSVTEVIFSDEKIGDLDFEGLMSRLVVTVVSLNWGV